MKAVKKRFTRKPPVAVHGSDLREIPGIGPSLEKDLRDLGFSRVSDLRGRDPERMYRELCRCRGEKIDRCVLYVFRCAVYYASHANHDPDRLKWWNWTDDRFGESLGRRPSPRRTRRFRSA